MPDHPLIAGWKEYVALPELGLRQLRAKLDTGADGSALDVVSMHPIGRSVCTDGKRRSRLVIGIPLSRQNGGRVMQREVDVVGHARVTSSNGATECRPVVETTVTLGPVSKRIRVTLTDRADLKFRMILGRTALQSDIIVDPNTTFQLTAPKPEPPGLCADSSNSMVVLSRNPELYSTRRLVETAAAIGHRVRVVDPMNCIVEVRGRIRDVTAHGQSLLDADLVVPRIGTSITNYGLAVVRQFEMMGCTCINSAEAIARSRDKLRALQILSNAGLPVPDTIYARDPRSIYDAAERLGGAPLVLKVLQGTQGVGVTLAESTREAERLLQQMHGVGENLLIQRFIGESRGRDVRVFVVGGRAVTGILRQAQGDEFRSNLHRGGMAIPFPIDDEYARIAVTAARAMGLEIAGVDLLISRNGPLVVEVNSSPGLEGVEAATGLDVAGMIMRHLTCRVPAASQNGTASL